MRHQHHIILLLLCVGVISAGSRRMRRTTMSAIERVELREQAREMFYHGYNSYLRHAFPADELRPLKCAPRIRESNPETGRGKRGSLDDALGGFSLTLVDSLTSLAVMGTPEDMAAAVKLVVENVKFNESNEQVSVFETNIRVLGGLISTHVLLTASPNVTRTYYQGTHLEHYSNELLDLAVDLANRLLVAFNTETSIPLPRINLSKGVVPGIDKQTCSACAGTLLIEFGTLSRITGDSRYERAAMHAMRALWERRSALGMVGGEIDVNTGEWTSRITGVGAGVDSFLEYLLKGHILFGYRGLLDMFDASFDSIKANTRHWGWHVAVDMDSGAVINFDADSLAAFWPGLLSLYGDVSDAIETFDKYASVWRQYGLMPEVYNIAFDRISGMQPGYPLRPELAESAYLLYSRTGDPKFLYLGREMLQSINRTTRVKCGFASVSDVESKELEDRMDSFVLSETLKYLYLLFDNQSTSFITLLSRAGHSFVFSTEGHLFPVPYEPLYHVGLDDKHVTCPASGWGVDIGPSGWYRAVKRSGRDRPSWPFDPHNDICLLKGGKDHRPMKMNPSVPADAQFSMTVLQGGRTIAVWPSFDNSLYFHIEKGSDARLEVTDGSGRVLGDTLMKIAPAIEQALNAAKPHFPKLDNLGAIHPTAIISVDSGMLWGSAATFGPTLPLWNTTENTQLDIQVPNPPDACSAIIGVLLNTELWNGSKILDTSINGIAVVRRGGCMFMDKIVHLQDAGYSGVVVVDHVSYSTLSAGSVGLKQWWVEHGVSDSVGEWPGFSMADDGSNRTVDIPSVLVSKRTGEYLLERHNMATMYSIEWDEESDMEKGEWSDCVGVRVDGLAFRTGADQWFTKDDLKRIIY